MSRRILITGGAGFVGLHLARTLAAEAANSVTLLDNFARGRDDAELAAALRAPNLTCRSGDLLDPMTLEGLGSGFDEVYHLAAVIGVKNVTQRPHDTVRVNAITMLNVLEWWAKGGADRLMFSSTSEAYAWTMRFHDLPIPTPEGVPLALTEMENPRSSYAGSKVFGELAVHQYAHIYDKPFTIVRYHNVYGPRMGYEHVIPELFLRAANGENPLQVYSTTNTRAFCYVDDAVRLTIQAMRQPELRGLTLNVGNDREEVTIAQVAKTILAAADIDADLEAREAANDPIPRRCPDMSRARELFGYEPRYDLRAGVAKTVAWYRTDMEVREGTLTSA